VRAAWGEEIPLCLAVPLTGACLGSRVIRSLAVLWCWRGSGRICGGWVIRRGG
jgi:hypothetical protein